MVLRALIEARARGPCLQQDFQGLDVNFQIVLQTCEIWCQIRDMMPLKFDGSFLPILRLRILQCLVDTCVERCCYDFLLRFALLGWYFNSTCVDDSIQEIMDFFTQGFGGDIWRTCHSWHVSRSEVPVSFDDFKSQMMLLYK